MLLIAVAAALAFGGYRLVVDGRFRGRTTTPPPEPARKQPTTWDAIAAAVPSAERGEAATLVQFSTAFCAPCRATRVVLGDVAGRTEGVVHLEVDAEKHLDLVRQLDIRRTPTMIVLDRDGNEITRAAGAPRRDQVLAALRSHIVGTEPTS